MDLDQLIDAARTAHSANNLQETRRLCKQILATDADNAQAMLLLGVIEVKLGDPFRGANLLEQVRALDPGSLQAPLWQGIALKKLGRLPEAIEASAKAFELSPLNPQVATQLGLYCLEARMLREAENYLTLAADLAPAVVQIQYSLAQCLELQGRHGEAVAVFRHALSSAPQTLENIVRLAHSFYMQNCTPLACETAKFALERDPSAIQPRLSLARMLLEENQAAEAEEHLRALGAKSGLDPQALVTMGLAAQSLGRLDEAHERFRQSVEAQPRQGRGYLALVLSRRITDSERPLLAKMRSVVEEANLPPDDLSSLWYALGRAHEDLGEFREAMEAYDEANSKEYELRFRNRPFDRQRYAESFEHTMSRFTAEFISANVGPGSDSDLPIFVVGMMRSGTTLVEQILSSHPEIGGAGEQAFWLDNWRSAMTPDQEAIDPRGIRTTAERYLSLLARLAPGKRFVIDKMPGNYPGLGIIHLALPKAKIIHVRRHPVDTCLSIYTTPNRLHAEFMHDRDNIVAAYREYLRIMEHWRSALPADCLLEIDYEELVSDPEPVTRAMIEFCGAPWSDACLKPEQNPKPVATPSAWQVRQPIYSSSSGSWRRFEPWLGAFNELIPDSEKIKC